MSVYRDNPGRCIVCDAPNCACTATAGPITVDQLPATTAAARATSAAGGPFSTDRHDDTTRTPTPDPNATVATLQESKLPTDHQSGAAARVVGRSQPPDTQKVTL